MKLIMAVCLLGMTTFSNVTLANSINIQVKNVKINKGAISCSLYNQAKGFPKEEAAVAQQRVDANVDSVSCIFNHLIPGIYAVSVMHDLNDNHKMDKNFIGAPKEDWGVSNNVRPTLRAPTFEEASFELKEAINIEIKLE
ncbi:MAG: DUF2141 domain-containing protein [Kangiellaceae bacterium]|nr:DUF2141 domain-containing protein [Kangiellaceae bacterium]